MFLIHTMPWFTLPFFYLLLSLLSRLLNTLSDSCPKKFFVVNVIMPGSNTMNHLDRLLLRFLLPILVDALVIVGSRLFDHDSLLVLIL